MYAEGVVFAAVVSGALAMIAGPIVVVAGAPVVGYALLFGGMIPPALFCIAALVAKIRD